jgi:hypothetical protein
VITLVAIDEISFSSAPWSPAMYAGSFELKLAPATTVSVFEPTTLRTEVVESPCVPTTSR